MPFSTRMKIRFGDTDPAGLVYYPNIFHYFHIAMEEYFSAHCGISYAPRVTAILKFGRLTSRFLMSKV